MTRSAIFHAFFVSFLVGWFVWITGSILVETQDRMERDDFLLTLSKFMVTEQYEINHEVLKLMGQLHGVDYNDITKRFEEGLLDAH